VTVRALIQLAYQLQRGAQTIGGPAWLNSEHFDIVAKMPFKRSSVSSSRRRAALSMYS
jgi:uncharacterized protein (TIGR03435 family)